MHDECKYDQSHAIYFVSVIFLLFFDLSFVFILFLICLLFFFFVKYLRLQGPLYAIGIDFPLRQAFSLKWHALWYVTPSAPHTCCWCCWWWCWLCWWWLWSFRWYSSTWRCLISLLLLLFGNILNAKLAGDEDDVDEEFGHFLLHLTQCGLKFWSNRQCLPDGHLILSQEPENKKTKIK